LQLVKIKTLIAQISVAGAKRTFQSGAKETKIGSLATIESSTHGRKENFHRCQFSPCERRKFNLPQE
jgi:hypothetical protein